MKRSNLILLLFLLLLINISKVNALEIDDIDNLDQDVVEEVKYFKILTVLNGDSVMSMSGNIPATFVIEITEDEFYGFAEEPDVSNTIDVGSYKLTSKLVKAGNYYNYSAEAVWKNYPSVRSYDTIAFGFYSSVMPNATALFEQYYCISGSGCTTQTSGYRIYTGTNGTAATYYLPSGTLTALKQKIYTTMKKTDSSSTITSQKCVASYGHSNSTSVTYTQAKDFTINTTGLHYASAANSYSVSTVTSSWSGTW